MTTPSVDLSAQLGARLIALGEELAEAAIADATTSSERVYTDIEKAVIRRLRDRMLNEVTTLIADGEPGELSGKARAEGPKRLPRGRHGLPRRAIVHRQRERMLLAVAEAVAELGYETTTVGDIISRARLSRRTFYEHFADKEECFLAAYDTVVEQLLAAVGAAYEEAEGWPQKVHDGLRTFLSSLASEPVFARMCVVEVLAAGPEARGRRDAAMRVFVDFLEPGRAEAPKGIVVPELASEIAVGGIYEAIYARLVGHATAEMSEMLPELLYCVFVLFIGHQAAVKAVEKTRQRGPTPDVAGGIGRKGAST